ncbi:hypothetical protein ACH4U6_35555 [Streptomyces netropsis]|uniref:hypothetical protein n=1 Tax=Streptomyces netropsis TaxID=55404 RepID=UPI0037998C7A
MTHDQVVQALDEARFGLRQDSRHEDLAVDERGPAEVAEWERIAALLAETTAVYDPAADPIVVAELAVDTEQEAARRAEEHQDQLVAGRAAELEDAARNALLDHTEPRPGDEHARIMLAHRASPHTKAVDAWLAHALATHRGPFTDPAARHAATALLPAEVTAQAALLAALALLDPAAGPAGMPSAAGFAGDLARAAPHATARLADALTRAAGTPVGAVAGTDTRTGTRPDSGVGCAHCGGRDSAEDGGGVWLVWQIDGGGPGTPRRDETSARGLAEGEYLDGLHWEDRESARLEWGGDQDLLELTDNGEATGWCVSRETDTPHVL